MRNPFTIWLLIPLLLVTTWLGARGLNANPYWLDEVWSVYIAGGAHTGPLSPTDLWSRNANKDPRNAVGYHLLLAGWGAAVGWTPFAARASSLLFGVLAVAWTYRLGRDLASPVAGIGAAAVVGTSAFYIYYLHELRTYSLSVLLTVVILWTYFRSVTNHRPQLRLYVAFVLSVIGILYTYYFGAIIIAVFGLYHLLFVPKTRRWLHIPVLLGIAGLIFLPWFGAMLSGLKISLSDDFLHNKALAPPEVIGNLVYYFSNGVIVFVIVAIVVGLRQRGTRAAWFFALASVAFVMLANARLQIIEAGRERYMLLLWPLLAVLCGIGFAQLWRFPGKRVALPFLGLWMFIGIHTSLATDFTRNIPGAQPLPWDAVADFLTARATAEDAVIVHLPIGNWVWEVTTSEYYLHNLPARFTLLESLPGKTAEELRRSESEFVAGASQVWLGLDKSLPPAPVFNDLQQMLNEDYVSCGVVLDLPRMSLALYMQKPLQLDSNSAVVNFGDGISLKYVYPLPDEVENRLGTTLIWAVDKDVPPYTYSVALHVLDASGQLVAQQDYGLPGESLACRQTSIPLDTLPPGEYTLTVAIYRWENGERLTGTVVATREQGDRLPLGMFTVGG